MDVCPQCGSDWCLRQGSEWCHRTGKQRRAANPETVTEALVGPPADRMVQASISKSNKGRKPRKARR